MSVASSRLNALPKERSLQLPAIRNRSRMLAGTGLIALCALLGAVLYSQAGERQQVLALATDIPAGHTIQRSDLKSVGVASEGPIASIKTQDARLVMGRVATSNLTAGTLLTESVVAPVDPPAPGQAIVGTALKRGQFPTSLRIGDVVLVVIGPSTASSTSQVTATSDIRGTVTELGAFDETNGTATVSLRVESDDAAAVASAGSASNLALAVLGT
jgi:hypothetical protein